MANSIIAQRGKRMSKDVKFIGEPTTIYKLSTDDVKAIQDLAREVEKRPEDDQEGGLDLLKKVIRAGSEGGEELTDEDFGGFPMEELSLLSGEIMKFSGIGADEGKDN